MACQGVADEILSICDILNIDFKSLVLHYDAFTKIYDNKDMPKKTVCVTVNYD